MNRLSIVAGFIATAALGLAGCSSAEDSDIPNLAGLQEDCVWRTFSDGYVADCTLDMSDARVSGDIHVEFSGDWDDEPAVFEGTSVITNDRGTWTGECTGTLDNTTDFTEYRCDYVGGGEYEGMTLESHIVGITVPSVMDGVIHEA